MPLTTKQDFAILRSMTSYKKRDWLKALRKKCGHSAAFVGGSVGVSADSVFQWEAGLTRPDTGNLFRLAKLLGVKVLEEFEREVSEEAGSGVV